MSFTARSHSIATISWIDPRTGLPEVDRGDPGPNVTRQILLANRGYRFVNFLEVFINVDDQTGYITGHGFTRAAGQYRGPSYGGFSSEAYENLRSVRIGSEPVGFRQIVGSRTVSPETIGEMFFGPLGRMIANRTMTFPPIWTELEIEMFADGRFQGRILRHSLFPSMNVYIQDGTSNNYNRLSLFDAIPNLTRWKTAGWGRVAHASGTGPTAGNPWGLVDSAVDDLYRAYSPGVPG